MNKLWIPFVIYLCVLARCQTDSADSQQKATSTDAISLSPYFQVTGAEPGVDALPLKRSTATVNIIGVIAYVTITQEYENTGSLPLEASYIFPASTAAAVHSMKLKLNNTTIKAIVQEKQQARQTYEDAKQQGRAASLLEQQTPNIFSMQVANIIPGSKVSVEISYTELLLPVSQTYSFVYPTVVGPRYTGEQKESSAPVSTDNATGIPYSKSGVKPTYEFDIKVYLNHPATLAVSEIASSSHKIATTINSQTNVSISLHPSETFGGNRDFILNFKYAGDSVQSGVLFYEDPNTQENYFMVLAEPPNRSQITEETLPPREYIFVVDVSGSMWGTPLEIAASVLSKLISNLKPTDLFNLVFFESDVKAWQPRSVVASQEWIEKAVKLLNANDHSYSWGSGGTNLVHALNFVLNETIFPYTDDVSRTLIVVTDGYISVEKDVFDLIRQNMDKINVFTFGIGSAVNRYLVEGMARVGKGEPFVITDMAAAEEIEKKFVEYIAQPILTGVKLEWEGDIKVYDVEPPTVPDVYAERPIVVVGKFNGTKNGKVVIKGFKGNSEHYEQIFNLENENDHLRGDLSALKYLWARTKLQTLDDYSLVVYEREREDSMKQQIIDIGLKYNLLTKHTSFVAVSDEIVNEDVDKNVDVKVVLPLPEGVSDYAVGDSTRGMPPHALFLNRAAAMIYSDEAEDAESGSSFFGALGGQQFYAKLSGDGYGSNEILLLDIVPTDISVKGKYGVYVPIVPKNSVIPTAKTNTFRVDVETPVKQCKKQSKQGDSCVVEVVVEMYAAMGPLDTNAVALKNITLSFDLSHLKNWRVLEDVAVNVKVEVDVNGIVTVSVQCDSCGQCTGCNEIVEMDKHDYPQDVEETNLESETFWPSLGEKKVKAIEEAYQLGGTIPVNYNKLYASLKK